VASKHFVSRGESQYGDEFRRGNRFEEFEDFGLSSGMQWSLWSIWKEVREENIVVPEVRIQHKHEQY